MRRVHVVLIDIHDSWLDVVQSAYNRGYILTLISSRAHFNLSEEIMQLVNYRYIVDTSKYFNLKSAITMANQIAEISAIISPRDSLLHIISRISEEMGLRFKSRAALELCRNKIKMRSSLSSFGYSNPRFEDLGNLSLTHVPKDFKYFPCIIKPSSGHGSILTEKADSSDHLIYLMGYLFNSCQEIEKSDPWTLENGFICEEFMEGPIISAEGAFENGLFVLITLALATQQNKNICHGYGNIIPFYPDEEVASKCEGFCRKLCQDIGLDYGVCDIELIWSKDGPVVIEINARRMGGEMTLAYARATSHSYGDILLNAYLCMPVTKPVNIVEKSTLIRKIIAKNNGIISTNFSISSIALYPESEIIINYGLYSQLEVSDSQVLGRILLTGNNIDYLFMRADEVLKQIEYLSDLNLVFGSLPRLTF